MAETTSTRWPLRRPLIGLLAVWVLGVWLGLRFSLPLSFLFPLAGAIGVLAVWQRARTAGVIAFWLLLFLVGALYADVRVRSPSGRSLEALMDRPREQLVVWGRVVDDPVLLEPASPGRSPVWQLTLVVEQVNRQGFPERTRGRMVAQWPYEAEAPSPRYGDRWELTGVVRHRERRDWMWAWMPPYRMFTDADQVALVSRGDGVWLKRWAFAGRRAASERLGIGLAHDPEVAGILRALLLGYRHELPDEAHRLFALTGTLHVFAISGLHVGIIAGLLVMLIRATGVSRPRLIWWLAPLLIFYAVATGLRPSALRACAMALAFGAAFGFQRRPDVPSALALAAFVILWADPSQLTAPGFIFSFVIVAGLVRLYPVFARWLRVEAGEENLSLGEVPSGSLRWRQWGLGLMAASAAAWLASAPLTAQYFNLFSPIGLIGNLLVIPAAFVVVLTGFLSLTLGALSEGVAEVFNYANWVWVRGLIAAIDFLSGLPGAHHNVVSPGWGALAFFYAGLFGGLAWPTSRARGWFHLAFVGCLVLAMMYSRSGTQTNVRILNAGDGHAVLVRSEAVSVLIDAGPAYRSDRVLRALRRAGVNRLDALILTHPVASHVGGARAVMQAMPVAEIWRSPFPSRSPVYDDTLTFAESLGLPIREVHQGMEGEWPCGTGWMVLHPGDVTTIRRAADASLVLRVHRGTASVLLSGGAGGWVEQRLVDAPLELRAPVWVIGNQGRDGAASLAALARINPGLVVLSVGAFNRHGYPERDVVERLADWPYLQVWRTDEAGEVVVRLRERARGGRSRDRIDWQRQWGVAESP